MDHAGDAVDAAVVDVGVAQFPGHAGHHAEQAAQVAHAENLLHGGQEVVEGEGALEQAGRGLFCLLALEGGLGLVDERLHIAHAQDSAG